MLKCGFVDADNPYAPSAAALEAPAPPTQEELTRKRHLMHEHSLRLAGTLFLIGGAFWIVAGLGAAVMTVVRIVNGHYDSLGNMFAMPPLFAALAALLLWFARGLRKLKKEVRSSVVLLSYVGLLAFPLGTIVSAWLLHLTASKKGKFVFRMITNASSPRLLMSNPTTVHCIGSSWRFLPCCF